MFIFKCIPTLTLLFSLVFGQDIMKSEQSVFACSWDDALYMNGKCFKYVNESKTWEQAQSYCESLPGGGSLAQINSKAEVIQLKSSKFNIRSDYWIGANDIKTEGEFTWTDGSEANLNDLWFPNQPDNLNNEDCVMVYASTGKDINDFQCSWQLSFMCMAQPSTEIQPIICSWPDAVFSNGNCFKYFRDAKTWSQAEAYCESLPGGGSLAYISSNSDILLLKPSNYGFTSGVWIGAKKVKTDGVWRWPDRMPANLKGLWSYGEPNNNDAEDCVEFYPNGGINDQECDIYRPFICMDKQSQLSVSSDQCPLWPGSTYSEGKCFKFIPESKSWANAEAYCQSLPGGGTLAKFTPNTDFSKFMPLEFGLANGVWFGANDIKTEGVWRWTNQTPANLDNLWDTNQPDDKYDEDCAKLYFSKYKVNDKPCGSLLPFVCMGQPKTSSCTAIIDLIYVLDSSGSIGKENYEKQISFIIDLASNFQIGTGNVLFGAVVFSHVALKYFDLKDYPSSAYLHTALSSTPYMGYTTNTDQALDLITNSGMFTSAAGARSNSYKTVIVITDGQSDNRTMTQQAASRLKSQGVTINAVGIGATVYSELKAIASDSKNVFKVDSFDALKQIVTLVTQQACQGSLG